MGRGGGQGAWQSERSSASLRRRAGVSPTLAGRPRPYGRAVAPHPDGSDADGGGPHGSDPYGSDPHGSDRYGSDVLANLGAVRRRTPRVSERVPARIGEVVEDAETGFCGAVVAVEVIGGMRVVVLEDRRRVRRSFPMGAGFLLDGKPVELVRPERAVATGPTGPAGPALPRTASGSRAVAGARARVARAGRIWVEGRHDAELVERVWGADLRVEGVVVEALDGIDDLPGAVAAFAPGPGRRLGVLVDHLLEGTKESRIATAVARGPGGVHTRVAGHPFVDVWAAVRPAALGLPAWPEVPRGQPWKEGVIAALGWAGEPWQAWRRILGAVGDWTDLEPAILGPVESLVDFVTTG